MPEDPQRLASTVDRLVNAVRDFCLGLPDAVEYFPFGPETTVFKVHGRMFALFTRPAPLARLNVKVDPEMVPGLIDAHAAIGPGYHMNKRHWVSVHLDAIPGGTFPFDAVLDLIEDSYDLVARHSVIRRRDTPRPEW